jgi:addiction module HigA family antidote
MTRETRNQYNPVDVSPPGETLLETIEALGISQAELAERTGRPKKTINEIINGKAAITPETALQLERVTRVPANFWNNRERLYREALARKEEVERLKNQSEWLSEVPVREMVKSGWIQGCKDKVQQVQELLSYFGVASPEIWRTYYTNELKVEFRQSKAFDSHFGAVTAWLRQGEILSRNVRCAPYNKETFQSKLKYIRTLTKEQPESFSEIIIKECAGAGVAVVFLPEIKGARICGATRWIKPDKALMQLSIRYKTNDHLWHTFFHEAGHILLHGKTESFIECNEQNDKEKEADEFAVNFLIPRSAMRKFIEKGDFSIPSIVEFSREQEISPAIVVGQLQHRKLVLYNQCNKLKSHLTWKAEI